MPASFHFLILTAEATGVDRQSKKYDLKYEKVFIRCSAAYGGSDYHVYIYGVQQR